MRGMLRLKQAELQQLVEVEQARLARVEARLEQIEQGNCASAYNIILKQVEVQTVAAIHDVLPACSHIKQLHVELEEHLRVQNIENVGLPQTLWHDLEYRLHDVDAEAIVPISRQLPENARVITYILPKVEQKACVIHSGSYYTVVQACNALLTWIEINHYQIVGSNREIYLHANTRDIDFEGISNSVLEISFPCRKCEPTKKNLFTNVLAISSSPSRYGNSCFPAKALLDGVRESGAV